MSHMVRGKMLRCTVIAAVVAMAGFVQHLPAQTNLALNKPCTGVGIQDNDPQFDFGKAVDGVATTRWATGFPDNATFEDINRGWWQVDLQSAHTINKIVISWEFAFGRSYNIEVSTDGQDWTVAKHVEWSTAFQTNNGVDEIYFEPVSARYVKYQGLTRGQPYGHSFWEFEVYSGATVPANPPTFEYPGPTAAFTIEGAKCPCEIINVGPVQYGPFMFHTNTNYIGADGGYSTIIFPGGTDVKWTYRWKMYNNLMNPINNMAGIWYGAPVRGGASTDDEGILPLPITADIYTTWKVNYSGVSGSYTVAYDMWTDAGEEIMIFMNKTGRYAYRSASFTQVTLGGITWDVSAGGSEFLTCVFDPVNRPIYEVNNINLKDFFKVLIDHGKLNSNRMLRGMWVGAETGGNSTYDRTEGELTTTEWTISSPDAVAAGGRVSSEQAAQRLQPVNASRRMITVGEMHNGGIPGARKAWSLRGEQLKSHDAEMTNPKTNAVYIVR